MPAKPPRDGKNNSKTPEPARFDGKEELPRRGCCKPKVMPTECAISLSVYFYGALESEL